MTKFLAYSSPLLLALAPYTAVIIQTINPTLIGTLALIELIWLVVNGPGAVYSFISFMESRTDVKIAKAQEPPNQDDVDSACYVRRNERLIFVLQLLNFLIAVMVAFTPPNPESGIVTMLAQLGLTGGTIMLTYTSIRNRQYRKASNVSVGAKQAKREVRNEERDIARDIERDAERDVSRDVPRDIDRDIDRDRGRDIGRDNDRDKAVEERA